MRYVYFDDICEKLKFAHFASFFENNDVGENFEVALDSAS